MNKMIFDNERVEYKKLYFKIKNTCRYTVICCNSYKIEGGDLFTYLDGNLTSIIPTTNIDMESLQYE